MQSFVAPEDCLPRIQHCGGEDGIAMLDQRADPGFVTPAGDGANQQSIGLSAPRIWFSMSISLRLRSFQLDSSARILCISMFLTWTARYQAGRIICAMPRASFRSVLLRIVESETRMWRASATMIGTPAGCSSRYNRMPSDDASTPTRSPLAPAAHLCRFRTLALQPNTVNVWLVGRSIKPPTKPKPDAN
jgi:hypothetical protein